MLHLYLVVKIIQMTVLEMCGTFYIYEGVNNGNLICHGQRHAGSTNN